MAGIAGGRQAGELTGSGVFVTVVALQQSMRANQRKAILMVTNVLQGDLPTLHGVATFAIGAELTAMDVGVAIRAVRAYVLEYETGVALRAGQLLMHSPQRITCLVVIEFGIGSNRLPTGVGMAVLTGYGEGPMRIGDFGLRAANTRPLTIRWLL
ncbi:MAG: hypothetical protein P4L87_08400 [Formivibrio sp.]|nr:hypothetical protein [Formivibrio sp.]